MEEREKFEEFLEHKGLSDRTIKEYLYYYDKFGTKENFYQDFVDDFLKLNKFGLPCRAFISNYKEFLLRIYPDDNKIFMVRLVKRTGRKEEKVVDFVTEEEVLRVANYMEERNSLMIRLSFYGGLRAMGLLSITARDFNWQKWAQDRSNIGIVKVTEKNRKQREVFVPGTLMQEILEYLHKNNTGDNPIFNIKYDTWHHILTRDSKKSIGKRVRPHMLRHGCATWLMDNGWIQNDVKEYLGHDSIVSTQVYTHVNRKSMETGFKDIT